MRKPGEGVTVCVQTVPFQCRISIPLGLRRTAQASLAGVAAAPCRRPLNGAAVADGAASAAPAGPAVLSAKAAAAAQNARVKCLCMSHAFPYLPEPVPGPSGSAAEMLRCESGPRDVSFNIGPQVNVQCAWHEIYQHGIGAPISFADVFLDKATHPRLDK